MKKFHLIFNKENLIPRSKARQSWRENQLITFLLKKLSGKFYLFLKLYKVFFIFIKEI